MKKHGNATHGMTATSEYRIWKGIKSRCYNRNRKQYPRYGGRGITICDRWCNSFETFLADMGKRPSINHSIERRDNNGNYTPDNCYWATWTEQARNKRNNVLHTKDGITKSLTEWAEYLGMPSKTLFSRYYRGHSTDVILGAYMRTRK